MLRTDAAVDVVDSIDSMASRVTIRARSSSSRPDVQAALAAAFTVFETVDRTCTRFDPDSDLMRANRAANQWVSVHRRCYDALAEAHAAYRRTLGRFDPRVHDDLVRLGYARSYRQTSPAAGDPDTALTPRTTPAAWAPQFRASTCEVRLGDSAVDLGGIAKGLAVRWAARTLLDAGIRDAVVEAGGDCYCAGRPGDAPRWRVAVENPHGGAEPLAVVELVDEAVATSSVRLRSWLVGDRTVHHLIDPSTGLPGGDGLASVTVIDDDPAGAEVWSKVLFLAGARGVATTADLYSLPALWVGVDGSISWSAPMTPRLVWTASS